jgi:APA family basic amino acid/polyamine antiporter
MASVFFETEIAFPGWTFQYALSTGHVTALALIVLLTAVNYRGVIFSKYITNVSSVIKIAALGLFILFGLWSGSDQPIDYRINAQAIDFGQLVVAFGVALIAVAWAFAGWEEVTFVAGEVREPARNLPRALVLGTASVTVVYLLVNYIYLKAMPVGEMAGVVRVGEAAANVLFGGIGRSAARRGAWANSAPASPAPPSKVRLPGRCAISSPAPPAGRKPGAV